MKSELSLLALIYGMTASAACGATVIDPSDRNIRYIGRWNTSKPSQPWAQAKSSSIIVSFQGTSIAVDLKGSSSDFLRVIVDGDAVNSVKTMVADGVNVLASGLSDATHQLELIKETDQGRLYLRGIHLDNGGSLAELPSRPSRRIEFYGDSNQAGYSLESERNEGGHHLQGAYYTYPGIVARMFGAEHINFSKSGATIGSLHTAHGRIDWDSESPLWDFKRFPADLVVVNIGANDRGSEHEKKEKFQKLLNDLRQEYSDAHIVLFNAYGWAFNEPANFIHEVIAERGDANMSSAIFPWVFAQYHGCEYDHGGMAMVLANHVQSVMGWFPGRQDVMSGFGVDGDVANGSFERVAPFGGWGWRYSDDAGVRRVNDRIGAYDGDHFLRLEDGAQSQQTNPASSGATVTVKAWMRAANDGERVEMEIDFRDQGMGAGEVKPIIAATELKPLTETWKPYEMAATAPTRGNPVFATRLTFRAAPGATVFIDAVTMSVKPVAPTNRR